MGIKEKNELTLDEVYELIANDLDKYGNSIMDEFPFRIILESPFIKKENIGLLDWLDENIDKNDFRREWVTMLYFKNEEDAVAFKLRWS